MPIFDKPEWIQHAGGVSIMGVDLDPSGVRMATCGSDNRIRIWAMRPVLSEVAEQDPAVPKQLAVLCDALTPINAIRFAASGQLLAAGTDDAEGLVYELREGRGSAVFGSGEAANIENWRLRIKLRGHASNVLDVAWAPDSRRLATCSVDNKVKVWDTTNGHCLRTLEGHVGHVKGVAWDPFDFFLASQGDREAIVWRLEDGSQVAVISEPFAKAPIVSFGLRPGWSPDGQTLALPNGYENGMHTVPLIKRNSWAPGEFCLVGHKGPVTAIRYNPHLYTPPPKPGAPPTSPDDEPAGSIVTAGSTDKTFSIWAPSAGDAPVVVGRGFFGGMVNDVAWSADGRVMVAAAYDGSVATALFADGELGRRVPQAEVDALLAQLYGDPALRAGAAGRDGGGGPLGLGGRGALSGLAAAPELMALEARARAEVEREERLNSRLRADGAAAAAAAGAAGAAAGSLGGAAAGLRPPLGAAVGLARAAMPPPAPPPPRVPLAATQNGVGPAGRGAGIGSNSPAKAAAGGARGGPAGTSGRDADHPPAKRIAVQPVGGAATAAGARAGAAAAAATAAPAGGAATPAGGGIAGAQAGGGVGFAAGPQVLVPVEAVHTHFSFLIHAQPGSTEGQVELQALNSGRDARGRPAGELLCLVGGQRRWTDVVQGAVVALAGSSRLAAAATGNGDLMVYSPAGRRLFPPIRLGWPASFLTVAPGSSLLLALLTDGSLKLWDFGAGECLLESSVAPLLLPAGTGVSGMAAAAQQPTLKVTAVRITAAGAPLVVLSNAHAYVHHGGLRTWVRVADDAFPASAFTTNLTSAATGELSKLQAAAAQRRHPADVLATSAAHAARPAVAARSEQALLEHNLASAAALQSPAEWRLWLITYVRRLAADEDESRLRDLISELLGPLRWTPATHGGGRANASAAAPASGGSWEPALGSSVSGGRWAPVVLGFDKRRLLREVVLKEVARNRSYQQLVAEVLEQLKQVDAAAAAAAAASQQPQQQQHTRGQADGVNAPVGDAAAGPAGAASSQPMVMG
ncbi:hypothetical protein HYH02_010749 [Chlamydomonas schloesseri]|uniref:Protein HIRA n=1 Tax=Chlamydomonas schloesseri TaxID=2026947 RepID=A0A835W390_9CHLO|nr:hypothetical protein HYH02_010749 [Chlamydomonas schloesseri]|eukprot:KAG2438957.1 hypothetical protein HYH02_010749 [Chlamydomonas schloesseri]